MVRIEALIKDPLYCEYLAKNEESEKERKFCRHSFQHLVDVARITYIMMLESGSITRFMQENDFNLNTAREVIYAAALVHDIGRWREYETGEDHSLVSAELAEDILKRAGFRDNEIEIIQIAVREHRRAADKVSLLGNLLYKADKFSRLCTRCGAQDQCFKFGEMLTGNTPLIY